MRTTIEIDDQLMADVLRVTGLKTKREAVEMGLRTLLPSDSAARLPLKQWLLSNQARMDIQVPERGRVKRRRVEPSEF